MCQLRHYQHYKLAAEVIRELVALVTKLLVELPWQKNPLEHKFIKED